MNITKDNTTELLIVSISPQNLERGDLWFAENLAAIKKAMLTHPWWRDNALLIEKDLVMKPSLLVRRLIDMGYERAGIAAGKGIFAVHGGVVDVWPLNTDTPYAIEFVGNAISEIIPREQTRGIAGAGALPPRVIKKDHTFSIGGYIVHTDHGIGIFRGIQDKYYKIEYAAPGPGREPDILLVPIDQKDRLSPFVGFTTPVIHRLGGALWSRTKRRVREDAEKLARSLFTLYAARHRATRPAHETDHSMLDELRETFGYTETPDQLQAEKDIMADLARERPMDRVLVGDVGFGKTEIAIRAAAAVIAAGKQVAVLAPTTVLAAQHERTFRERLENLAITSAMLSRLTRPKDEKQILKAIADGRVDCIIGTSRLLSRDVVFKNLGLVIIDEEQRFGVKQKERCKELRTEVDILSLSATPIPRTLSLALAKLRDISRIDTPPAGRVPITTAVLPYNQKIIRDAITHELSRGGQVYFLHNRIETIGMVKEKLQKLISPSSTNPYDRKELLRMEKMRRPRIGVIHGRMGEQELLGVMDDFRNHKVDILLATTIIENGLDISSANTLVVDDAARLGLAAAHQLRGRIGRGAVQAFAYFLYKPHISTSAAAKGGNNEIAEVVLRGKHQRLTEKGSRRLDALKEYAELGAGYDIALRDLEIRGAGNVFGREQSGAINKVGLNLYCQMIAEATEEFSNEKRRPLQNSSS